MEYTVALNEPDDSNYPIIEVVKDHIPDEQDARAIAFMYLRWGYAEGKKHMCRCGIYNDDGERESEVVIWYDGTARFYKDGHKWMLNRDGSLGDRER